VVLCVVIAAGSTYARDHLKSASSVGSIVGTIVSATILLLIGSLNLYTAYQLWKQWTLIRNGTFERRTQQQIQQEEAEGIHSHDGGLTYHTHLVDVTPEAEVEGLDGFLTRCCPSIFRSVDRAWKMYPIGLLFGLGFDTASEVGLLALAATTPDSTLSFRLSLKLSTTTHTYTHTQAHTHNIHTYRYERRKLRTCMGNYRDATSICVWYVTFGYSGWYAHVVVVQLGSTSPRAQDFL